MRLHLLLASGVLLYAAASILVCLLVRRDEPAGMPRVVRAAVSGAVWWALGARRPKPRHSRHATRTETRHV